MTIPRLIGLLVIFGVLGIGVVYLRADQVRRSNRIQQLQLDQLALRQRIWSYDMEIARLRSPAMVRDRTKRFAAPLLPPYEGRTVLPPDDSWVADD